jgi:histidinol-phosphate aminotransferase
LGPSPLAVSALRTGLNDINRYPDGSCHYLKNALAGKFQINPEEILIGNGSNELIELAVRTFLTPGDESIKASPSFVVYSMIVQASNGSNIIVPLKEWPRPPAMASAITGRQTYFYSQPNNPTGTINTGAEMTPS